MNEIATAVTIFLTYLLTCLPFPSKRALATGLRAQAMATFPPCLPSCPLTLYLTSCGCQFLPYCSLLSAFPRVDANSSMPAFMPPYSLSYLVSTPSPTYQASPAYLTRLIEMPNLTYLSIPPILTAT